MSSSVLCLMKEARAAYLTSLWVVKVFLSDKVRCYFLLSSLVRLIIRLNLALKIHTFYYASLNLFAFFYEMCCFLSILLPIHLISYSDTILVRLWSWSVQLVSVSVQLRCTSSSCHHSGLRWTSECLKIMFVSLCAAAVCKSVLREWLHGDSSDVRGLTRLLPGCWPEWAHPWQ